MGLDAAPVLAQALPLASLHEVPAYPNRRELIDVLKTSEPTVRFLDMTTHAERALAVLEELRAVAPNVPVIALLASGNPEFVLHSLRQGAADFLIQPFTSDQMEGCLKKIARAAPGLSTSGAGVGKVVAVVPVKGASGATTIACSVASQCRRLGAKKILLADMDPLAGTVSFVLKLRPTCTFADVLQRASTLDADLWKQMVTQAPGMDVLAAPQPAADTANELPAATPMLQFAQALYDAVVVDCAGPYGTWNLSLAAAADHILLVSTNQPASLAAAQRAIAYLEHRRVGAGRVKLVINRYMKDAGLLADNIPKAVGMEVFQVIPSDPDAVRKSLIGGGPVPRGTAIGKSLAALAERLVQFDSDRSQEPNKRGLLASILR
jgi:Flp pilus assembly CpaE family ATPase